MLYSVVCLFYGYSRLVAFGFVVLVFVSLRDPFYFGIFSVQFFCVKNTKHAKWLPVNQNTVDFCFSPSGKKNIYLHLASDPKKLPIP